LPEPVGALISVCEPLEMAFQPPSCAGVGPAKDASNQRRTGALKGASGSVSTVGFESVVNPPILRAARLSRPSYSTLPPVNLT
jgi:hypothetical protein